MDFGLCDSILSTEKIITGHINKTFMYVSMEITILYSSKGIIFSRKF